LSDILRRFVRHALGCACPEETLADIRVEPPPAALAGLPVERALNVGGRLLVLICSNEADPPDPDQARRLAAEATRLRDALGFNRVRIVFADPAAEPQDLSKYPAPDDRIHWHRVTPEELEGVR